jgi:hypothetical protein
LSNPKPGLRSETINKLVFLRLWLLIVVLPRHSIDRGFPDTKGTGRETVIATAFVERINDHPTFHFVQGKNSP